MADRVARVRRWIGRLWDRIRYGEEMGQCDGCYPHVRYRMSRLNACSGDVWLCDDCIEAYMKDACRMAGKGEGA